MKTIFILLLLPFCSVAQSTTQYLVTNKNDTVYYQGDLIVDNDNITKWKSIKADDIEYPLSKIKSASFNNNFYYNCDGRHLYKQVIQGKINVFALNDRDTIPDRNGNLRRKVFIQNNPSKKPLVYSAKNLASLLTDDQELAHQMKDMHAKQIGGNAMIFSGIGVAAPTIVIGLFGAFFSALFGDNETANSFLMVAALGTTVGSGLMGGGFALKSGSHKLSLHTIHVYNAH